MHKRRFTSNILIPFLVVILMVYSIDTINEGYIYTGLVGLFIASVGLFYSID